MIRFPRQHVIDYPKAERKTEAKPNRLRSDFSGKAMATIERITV